MSKISFVYFDLGGVFFNWDNYFGHTAKDFGLELDLVRSYFDKFKDAITLGKITPEDLWSAIKKEERLGPYSDSYDFLSSWASDYVPIPSVHAFAKNLSQHYQIGIISDIYKGMYEKVIEKNIVPALNYKQVIISCDVGLAKPNQEIFLLAQQLISFPPEEILFIDDSDQNLLVPRQLGWKTHHFDTLNPEFSLLDLKKKYNLKS